MVFRTRLLIVFACLSVSFMPGFAHAQASEEGAQSVRAMFQKTLDYQAAVNKLQGGSELITEGELVVEPAGNYYAVTFPHIKLKYPTGELLDIGMISANVSQRKTPGRWAVTMAIPTPLVFLNASGTQDFRINIGSQSTAGIWDEKSSTFMKMDAAYKDITLDSDNDETLEFTLPQVAVRYDFDVSPEGLWSGPGFFVINNLKTNLPQGGRAQVEQFRFDFAMDRYNPAVTEEFQKDIMALSESDAASDPEALSQKISQDMLNVILKSGNGFDGTYSFKNISFARPSETGEGEETIQIAQGRLGIALKDLLSPKAAFGMKMGFDGLAIAPAPENVPLDVLPKDLNFDFEISDIPINELIQTAQQAQAAGAGAGAQAAQMAVMGMALQMPMLLSQAGTKIILKDNYLANAIFRADISGAYVFSAESPLMTVGQGKIVLKGLDEMLVRASELMRNPEDPNAKQWQQITLSLNMLKAFAKPETADDGTMSYVMNIELTPAGKVVINGQDVTASFAPSAGEAVQPETAE